ncbi:MAG: IS66 family transposase [Marinobacter sp.]|nr:IS66 family transposase [Marinobacter sp.]
MVEGLQQELAAKKCGRSTTRSLSFWFSKNCCAGNGIQPFGASSEKSAHQIHLFDEAELEVEIDALRDQLPDDVAEEEAPPASRKRRQRGFSDTLLRERIELTLSDEEKVGASKTFFTKGQGRAAVHPRSTERFWSTGRKKAVFEQDGEERILAATRPVHPLGKCTATTSLLAYIITSKYADGLPLYRLEHMLKRLGHEISRTSMAHWVIRLDDVFKPLINLMREVQNSSDYLQADESRMYVLKEDGKTAQSDKWMWLTRGGPPGQPSVLFEYDPSRAGKVPVRLLDDFNGILQADGYSGYGKVCRDNNITRIGCWDHARRKFVEAIKGSKPQGKGKAHKGLQGRCSSKPYQQTLRHRASDQRAE